MRRRGLGAPSTARCEGDPRMRFVVPREYADGSTVGQDCLGYFPDLIDRPASGKAAIVCMSPRTFLDKDPTFAERGGWLDESIPYLRGEAKAGRCFAPLYFRPLGDPTYAWDRRHRALPHEGRHRALLAQRLGLRQIPVMVEAWPEERLSLRLRRERRKARSRPLIGVRGRR